MTKQVHSSPEEKQTPELLLRRFKLMDEAVEKVRKENLDAGVDSKVMGQFIQWRSIYHGNYKDWIAAVTNPKKPGKFNQIADLKNVGIIPEDRESEYEGKVYPYRKLNSIHKVKSGGKLWLVRHEDWYGLTKAGQEFHISVNDLDYYTKPEVEYEYVPKDPKAPDGPSILVGIIRQSYNIEQPGQKRIYLTPYSKEKVDEFMRYAITDEETTTSFVLIK